MPDTKEITKFIAGAIAENIFKYLYESIKPYKNNYQYFEDRIVDGKKIVYNHIIFELHPPRENHFELVEVISIEPKKNSKKQIRNFGTPTIVLSVDVLQVPGKACVMINHSPFFEDIMNNLMSPFDDKTKARSGHVCQVPDRGAELDKWISVYEYYEKISNTKNMRAKDFYEEWQKDNRLDKPLATQMLHDIQHLQTLINEGNSGHIMEKAKNRINN